ncbi:MAG TPA: hypothetical protein VMV44_01150 [Rectinemataceae bacterium]|nr:hypothetical protein [Rectinemataceae bacterium]
MIAGLVVGALALACVLLLLLQRRDGKSLPTQAKRAAERKGKEKEGRGGGPRPGNCTLCGSLLSHGESMKSDILPGQGDRMMRIFGCPHCLGKEGERLPRFCPVCETQLGAGDHAIARYFERPGRKHVHILGCTICRKTPKEAWHGR